jgi:hypothetical protein
MYNQINKIEAREALENTNQNLGQYFTSRVMPW